MVKLMDIAGNVFAEGENINEIIEQLNNDPNGASEWKYYYRPDSDVVNAYYCKSGEFDYGGEQADEIYDVIED